MKRFVTLLSFLIVFASLGNLSHSKSLSARQLLDQTISIYASCQSYLDDGQVKTVFLQKNGRRTVIKPFTTAFVRPSDFRYEFKDRRGEEEWNRYIVWRNAESVKSWWTIKPEVVTLQDLSRALAGATGVSSGSASAIPGLLMPDLIWGSRIKSLAELKLIGEESVDGRTARRIEGTDLRKGIVTLWIDQETSLILKIFETARFAEFETETTTTYSPRINVEIPPEKLAFNAPVK